jgi:predicted O-methyltransferase YrrM
MAGQSQSRLPVKHIQMQLGSPNVVETPTPTIECSICAFAASDLPTTSPEPYIMTFNIGKAFLGAMRKRQQPSTWVREPHPLAVAASDRLSVIYTANTHLSFSERLFLYAIVRGTIPRRALEIGAAQGGSGLIVASAMEDNAAGTIIGIEPTPGAVSFPEHFGRFRLIQSAAPSGIDDAVRLAGGKFDFVFYDGPNVHSASADIMSSIIPHLAERAYIVIDNALHYGLHQMVTDIVSTDKRLHDCGFVCTKLGLHDPYVAYDGLRLLRFETHEVSDPQPIIDREFRAAGLRIPQYDAEVLNHGGWWCRTVRACPRCSEKMDRKDK